MAYIELTLQQFQERFSSEEACLQAVYDARWPRGFICPHCKHNDGYRLSRRRVIQCCGCRRHTSITARTIFHRTHLPLKQWFLIIYLVAQDKGGISTMRIARLLGMHYATAWCIMQKVRIAMGTREENLKLAGYIELDEAFFGGRGRNTGRRSGPNRRTGKKRQVLVMIEAEGRQAGNVVMKVVPNSVYNTIKSVVESKVEDGPFKSWFRTDGWQAHEAVMALGHKLKMGHIPNHLQSRELPCISLAISHAKRFLLGTYHQYCRRHIQRYLDEFCYRFNRRFQWDQLASRLLTACTLCAPTTYKSLKATA